MKKQYNKFELEICLFECGDVITFSIVSVGNDEEAVPDFSLSWGAEW